MREPIADRPELPPGYLEEKRLPFAWARARLVHSPNYWVATVTPEGRPHVRPVWGVWHEDDALYFGTGARIAVHLARDPAVSIHLESADECVIVEGEASQIQDPSGLGPVIAQYDAKYSWQMKPAPGEFWRVTPRRAFGWLCDGSGEDGGAAFSATATRWRFDIG
ncbi:MAG: pyridoxamine 5'-phosphate oxidase family protein [Myxococcales bacterium]|nr:pyridoxamine 5'-phosphate oxidase family protein [Myxococcales bacterium]